MTHWVAQKKGKKGALKTEIPEERWEKYYRKQEAMTPEEREKELQEFMELLEDDPFTALLLKRKAEQSNQD